MLAHRTAQEQLRAEAGPAWQDSGLVFTNENVLPGMQRDALDDFDNLVSEADDPDEEDA